METFEKKDGDDIIKMIHTLCVLFLAIVLKSHITNGFSGQAAMIMIVVIVGLFLGSLLFRSPVKSA